MKDIAYETARLAGSQPVFAMPSPAEIDSAVARAKAARAQAFRAFGARLFARLRGRDGAPADALEQAIHAARCRDAAALRRVSAAATLASRAAADRLKTRWHAEATNGNGLAT